jgi:hypothetical protein
MHSGCWWSLRPLGRMNLRAVGLADRRHWHASVVLVKDLRLRALS